MPLARCFGLVFGAMSLAGSCRGVIVMGSGDPNFNDTDINPPGAALTNSGLQWTGRFGDTGAAVISPHHFISAKHLGVDFNVANPPTFVLQGVTYTTTAKTDIPNCDLTIWTVSGTFPVFAPLFSTLDAEIGRRLIVFGGGTQRGVPYSFGGQDRGWLWGPLDGRLRWGINEVAAFDPGSGFGSQIYATFDFGPAGLGDYECALSNRDSGGPVYLREAGVWKVAAVNFSVDGYFYEAATGGVGPFLGALYDATGLYTADSNPASPRTIVPGPAPVPTGFYSTRISPHLAEIRAIIGSTDLLTTTFSNWQTASFTPAQLAQPSVSGPDADPDGDGLTNFQEYAFGAPPWEASPAALPVVGKTTVTGTDYLTISYTRANGLTDVSYVVEASSDLTGAWSSGTLVTALVAATDQGDVTRVVVRDLQPFVTGSKRWMRVRVTSP